MKLFHIPLDISCLSHLDPYYLEIAKEREGRLQFFTREGALGSLCHCGHRIIDAVYTEVELELPISGTRRAYHLRTLLAGYNPELAANLLGGFSLLVLAE